jgi:hypothetical protein
MFRVGIKQVLCEGDVIAEEAHSHPGQLELPCSRFAADEGGTARKHAKSPFVDAIDSMRKWQLSLNLKMDPKKVWRRYRGHGLVGSFAPLLSHEARLVAAPRLSPTSS